jgi:hypothetical protein
MTPETYTKFTATGLPDLTGPAAVSGVGHQSFTKKQTLAWISMLAMAARSGSIPSERSVLNIIDRTPYLNSDLDYRPSDLKYNFGN